MAGGANSWLSPKRMAVLGGRKQEKCSSWRPKRFLTSQLPLSSLPEEFLTEETWGGGGAGSFGVTANSFGVTGGTSRSSISIELSIIHHPAIGVSPFMETRIQVQIIAQEPAEVESCMQGVPRFSTECCIAQEPAEVESCKVFHVLVRSAAVLCFRRLMVHLHHFPYSPNP